MNETRNEIQLSVVTEFYYAKLVIRSARQNVKSLPHSLHRLCITSLAVYPVSKFFDIEPSLNNFVAFGGSSVQNVDTWPYLVTCYCFKKYMTRILNRILFLFHLTYFMKAYEEILRHWETSFSTSITKQHVIMPL